MDIIPPRYISWRAARQRARRCRLLQDGKPVSAAIAGSDVKDGVLTVTGSRLYGIINNHRMVRERTHSSSSSIRPACRRSHSRSVKNNISVKKNALLRAFFLACELKLLYLQALLGLMIVRYLFFDPRISFCHKGFYDLINCLSKLSIAKKVDEGKRTPFLASGCLGFSTGGVVDKKPRWEYSWVSSILVAEGLRGCTYVHSDASS